MFRLFDTFRSFRFPYNIFYQIKYLPHDIKMRFQRAFRGWADCDVGDMDMWFMEVIPQMLQYLRDYKFGTPVLDVDASYEENKDKWNKILDKMIFLCQEMNKETCSEQNEIVENYIRNIENNNPVKIDNNACERQQEIDQYRQQCRETFFKYFKEYFHNLWI